MGIEFKQWRTDISCPKKPTKSAYGHVKSVSGIRQQAIGSDNVVGTSDSEDENIIYKYYILDEYFWHIFFFFVQKFFWEFPFVKMR